MTDINKPFKELREFYKYLDELDRKLFRKQFNILEKYSD